MEREVEKRVGEVERGRRIERESERRMEREVESRIEMEAERVGMQGGREALGEGREEEQVREWEIEPSSECRILTMQPR